MNKEDIIRMAHEAGFTGPVPADGYMGLAYDRREGGETGGSLERFAALVAAAEREACAKVCETYEVASIKNDAHNTAKIFNHCAAAIRARGQV